MLNENLMEHVLERDNLMKAFSRVKANGGAPGVDGMTAEGFAGHAKEHWPQIAARLLEDAYQPGVIRGVSIPKSKVENVYWAYPMFRIA